VLICTGPRSERHQAATFEEEEVGNTNKRDKKKKQPKKKKKGDGKNDAVNFENPVVAFEENDD
jgi:hypothetical protein